MSKSSQEVTTLEKINSSASTLPKRSKGEETRERIFQLALEYFNRNGIEYVGIRELARELGLSPGNVSYYFPTKDDLVLEITKRLSEENTQLFQEVQQDLTLTSFVNLFVAAFHNHYTYRCIFTSFVHMMKHYQKMRENYIEVQRRRRASIMSDLEALKMSGCLKSDLSEAEAHYLVMVTSHLARFWVQEAEVLMAMHPTDAVIEHYAGMIASAIHPYATDTGKQELGPFMQRVITTL